MGNSELGHITIGAGRVVYQITPTVLALPQPAQMSGQSLLRPA